MVYFNWHRKRAIRNFNNAKGFAEKEFEIANNIQTYLTSAIKDDPSGAQPLQDTVLSDLNKYRLGWPAFQRRRMKWQRVGEERIQKIAHELRHLSAEQVSNCLTSIQNINSTIDRLYSKDLTGISDKDAQKYIRFVKEILASYIARIEFLIRLLSGDKIRMMICDVTIKGAKGTVIIDTSVFVRIAESVKEIREFDFEGNGDIVVVNQVNNELPGVLNGKSLPSTIAKDAQRLPEIHVKPENDEIDRLADIWMGAGIRKSVHDFKDTTKADINILTLAMRTALDNKPVTIVTDDVEIMKVASGLKMKHITTISSARISTKIH